KPDIVEGDVGRTRNEQGVILLFPPIHAVDHSQTLELNTTAVDDRHDGSDEAGVQDGARREGTWNDALQAPNGEPFDPFEPEARLSRDFHAAPPEDAHGRIQVIIA